MKALFLAKQVIKDYESIDTLTTTESYKAGEIIKLCFLAEKNLDKLLSELFNEYSKAKFNRESNYKYYLKFGGAYPDSTLCNNLLETIKKIQEIKKNIYSNINNIKSFKPWRYNVSLKIFLDKMKLLFI